jgi:hypothetical protein
MAMYEDGGVTFAQEQFDKSRERRDKQAKDEDKFSKRLLIALGAVNAVTSKLNNKANLLEQENLFEKSHYLSLNQNAQTFNKAYQTYVDQGYTNQEILELETINKLNGYITQTYGEGYKSDAVQQIAKDFAANPDNLQSYNDMIEAYSKIPNMTREELKNYIKTKDAPPRNIGEWFGSKIKKIHKSHDEETLTEEDKQAARRQIGGILGADFENVRTALTDWKAQDNAVSELARVIMANKDDPNFIPYKNLKQSFETRDVFDSNGIKRKVTYAISSGLGSNNENIVFDSTPVIDTVAEISEEEFTVDPQSLPMINNRVQGIISSIGANNTAASRYWNTITENKIDLTKVKNKSQLNGAAINIAYTMNNLKKYKLNEATSFAVATEFVLQQGANAYIDTTPTLFEIDKLSNQFDTVKISDYVVDILDNNKLSKSQKDEAALSMRQEIVEGINASNLSQDEKEKELLALDNIYKSVGYPSIEEEEEQKNDNTPSPPDEPEEEEIDYKSRAYKKKQNSIFKTIDKNRKNIPFLYSQTNKSGTNLEAVLKDLYNIENDKTNYKGIYTKTFSVENMVREYYLSLPENKGKTKNDYYTLADNNEEYKKLFNNYYQTLRSQILNLGYDISYLDNYSLTQ